MAHCRAPRQLARLGAVLAAGCFAFGLVTPRVAPAATPSAPLGDGRMVPATALAVALSRPGYQCLSDAKLVGAKPGQVGSLAVHLDGYVVAYSAAESHLSTGLFAYPGTLKVSEGSRSWTMPPPADPKDQYFQLGGLCAVQFGPGGAPDVLGEGFWGGAHCCFGPTLYAYSVASGAYPRGRGPHQTRGGRGPALEPQWRLPAREGRRLGRAGELRRCFPVRLWVLRVHAGPDAAVHGG